MEDRKISPRGLKEVIDLKAFMDKDFLLTTDTAKELYHDCAARLPILDYHCHINPQEIFEDRQFENITQVWLGGQNLDGTCFGDHYKWRLMRANGVEESFVTGSAPDRERFQKWAETLDRAIGNPLYHWSHLELQRYFGYTGVLGADTAEEVWELCNRKLQQPDMSVRKLIRNSGVTLLCTTDDPADDLRWHKALAEDATFDVQVLPAFRPDKAMNLEKPDYPAYIAKLGAAAGMEIRTFADLRAALQKRMGFFNSMGCRLSDHGLEFIMFEPASEEEIEKVFTKRLGGEAPTRQEELQFKTAFMQFVGGEYARLGWAMQIHFGCSRDNNTPMYEKLGPDTGFDAINTAAVNRIAEFLNALAKKGALPKTILYSLNPNDDEIIDSVIGCFEEGGTVGKVQHGAAWWFNDHKTGMVKQMTSLANGGLLGNFLGMLTDSRSFLSYPRHEYFRRILCDLLGTWVENGEYPDDTKKLTSLVKGICYNNAVNYFGFDLKTE